MVWIDPSLSLSLFFFSPLVVHPKPPLHIPVSEAVRERERERERKWWGAVVVFSKAGIVLEQLCSNTTTTL